IPPKTRVSGVVVSGRARAWQYSSLAQRHVVNDVVGGAPVVVFYDQAVSGIGNSSDLRSAPQVGATAVYQRTAAGRALSFTPLGSAQFRGKETGSVWASTGRAISGPLAGTRLAAFQHLDTYWFAWAAFSPGTSVSPPAPACTP